MEVQDFILDIAPEPVEVMGRYDKIQSITTIKIKGLGLDFDLDLPGDYTKTLEIRRIKEAVFRLASNGRLRSAPTLWAVIQQIP